jgi:hypothetical protein
MYDTTKQLGRCFRLRFFSTICTRPGTGGSGSGRSSRIAHREQNSGANTQALAHTHTIGAQEPTLSLCWCRRATVVPCNGHLPSRPLVISLTVPTLPLPVLRSCRARCYGRAVLRSSPVSSSRTWRFKLTYTPYAYTGMQHVSSCLFLYHAH